jgi:hypothetical protein
MSLEIVGAVFGRRHFSTVSMLTAVWSLDEELLAKGVEEEEKHRGNVPPEPRFLQIYLSYELPRPMNSSVIGQTWPDLL